LESVNKTENRLTHTFYVNPRVRVAARQEKRKKP